MNDDLKKACEVMAAGGLILYPTDTIWGIGCDATNEEAVRRVYELKRRSDHKAMLVLLDSEAKLNGYVSNVPDYSDAKNLAPSLVGEDGSVGIRITREAFSRQLCERFRKPVVSTSANISGEPSPASFSEISEEVKKGVDYIVEYRQDDQTKAKPSSIIKLGDGGLVQVIR